MLVGIMTMQRVPNYGSFLQAFALKRIVERLGHEVVFVDFHVEPDVEHRDSLLAALRCWCWTVARDLKATRLGQKILNEGMRRSDDWKSVMFSCNSLLGITDKRHYNVQCDLLIIGSDEVFNCLQLGSNIGYSLELFGHNAKANIVISYAASFGNTTLKKLENYGAANQIGTLLNKFEAISVRDDNSAKIIELLTKRHPLRHLDPVLIGGIENERWRPCNENKFMILYGYSYRFTKDECNEAMNFAHSRGLKLVAVGENQVLCDQHVRCRPDEVISYFQSASYVLTDTFHGTIFSIITHTPFATIPRGDINGQGGNVQKISSLLEQLCLSERIASSKEDICEKLQDSIDFKKADEVRHTEKKRSLSYLKRFLVGADS